MNNRLRTDDRRNNGTEVKHNLFPPAAAAVKTHFYWSMSRCGGSEQVLRDSLMNIVAHYRVSPALMSVQKK